MHRSKAFRLHQRERIRRKRAAYRQVAWAYAREDARWIGIKTKTPKSCRCAGCSNPRRYFGRVTRHEQLAAEVEAEELTDWLAIAEPTFDFWDNEADDAYNEL